MQNQIQVKNSFSWKPASKFIQFAFEQGGLRPFGREQQEQENLENRSPRKLHKADEGEQQGLENSYEPSNQFVDFQKSGQANQPIQITVTGHHVVDQISHTSVFASKAFVPTLTVNLGYNCKNQDAQGNFQKTKFIQLFIGEKSHSSQYQKYKIIKGGLRGNIRHRVKNQYFLKIQKIRFNILSSPQKLPRLILVVYQQYQNKRVYKTVMISDEFSVIDNHKILSIQSHEQLRLYFEQVQLQFLDKTGLQIAKITSLNKHKIIEQMSSFENYLIKKNKKIWNIVYAAYKYSHIVDLYFLNAQGKSKKEQFLQLWKQMIDIIRGQQPPESEKTCNHLDPSAKFVLKIHAQMKNVRFIIAKQFTKYLSVIASDSQFQANQTWTKFDMISEMKDAYSVCQEQIQAKLISDPIIKTSPIAKTISGHQVQLQTKKPLLNQQSKDYDQDFNQQDVEDEDDVQYEGESSQNYSVSNRKRGRKLGQKKTLDYKKQLNGYRQNKYPTRGGSRVRNKQDTEDSNDKKANIVRKNKEKEIVQNRTSIQTPVIGAPPFRVLNPAQAGQFKDQQTQSMQGKMIGIIPINPMMMGKKPQEIKTSTGMAMPKGVMPVMMSPGMNPQLMAMMGGLQGVMPMGNGVQAMMMPVQMDKNQQGGQTGISGMAGMGQLGHMGAMGAMAGMGGMGGMGAMGGMGGIPTMAGMSGMMPFMMGGPNPGISQGFMMPFVNPNAGDKSKQTDSQKQKNSNQKKQQKKDNTFPPNTMMQPVDLSKMSMMGQMPNAIGVMPNGQMMSMPQMMQMGMGGMGAMGAMGAMGGMGGMGMGGMGGMGAMMGANGIPQGIMMNPALMGMQKPTNQGKQQNTSKQAPTMPNNIFGGMPFMMAQLPNQLQNTDNSSQNSQGMQMGMMGQFPGMMQMPQQGQMSGNPGQGGMPMGYTMVINPDQARQMTPAQLQQLQMQMMVGKGVMMGMPKPDQNDQNKK